MKSANLSTWPEVLINKQKQDNILEEDLYNMSTCSLDPCVSKMETSYLEQPCISFTDRDIHSKKTLSFPLKLFPMEKRD